MKSYRLLSLTLIGLSVVGSTILAVGLLVGADGSAHATSLLAGFAGIGIVLVLAFKAPGSRMSLLVSLIVFAGVLLDVQVLISDWALENERITLAIVSAQVGSVVFLFFFMCLFVLLPLWFPTGHAIGPRWEWVWRLAAIGVSLAFVGSALSERTCIRSDDNTVDCLRYAANPWGIEGLQDAMFEPLYLVSMALAIPAVWSLVGRFRRAQGVERLQLRWLAAASTLLLVLWLVSLSREFIDWDPGELFPALMNVAFAGVVASIAVAVLKYRLYDIDRIISRTVSYALVVGLLALVFAAGVVWVPNAVPGAEDSPLLVAGSTLAVAALFNPLRRRVQHWVDRRFNRSRYDAERVMTEFVGSLRDRVDAAGVVDGWVGVVSETMQPSSVGVWVRE